MKKKLKLIIIFGFIINSSILVTINAQVVKNTNPSKLSISTNILGLATLNPNIDVEYAIFKSITIGSAIWWEVREVKDRWAECKLTYYPLGEAMSKLGVSLTGGYHTAWKDNDAKPDILIKESAPTIGFLTSYSWRFKKNNHIFISPIVGAKKTFIDNYDISPLQSVYIEGKINIGYIF